MSESPKSVKKSEDELKREFTNLCAKVGHLRLQIDMLERDMEVALEELRDVNLEALSVHRAHADAAKVEAEKVKAESKSISDATVVEE